MLPLISIVIPVYNVEKYIDRCVDCVINQTYKNIEILLIDDGSTDSSSEKCDIYAEKDSRIKVVHKANGGLSDARNKGIDIFRGEYITFIDSDDWVNLEYIELLYKSIVDNNSDISISDMIDSDGNGYEKDYNVYGIKENKYTSEEALYVILAQKEFNTSADGKLFKAEIFKKHKFKYGILYEDFDLIYKLIDEVSMISFVDAAKYYYFQREGSIVHSEMNKRHYNVIDIAKNIMDFVADKYPELKDAALSRYVFSNLLLLRGIINDKSQIEMQKTIRNNIKSRIGQIHNCPEIPVSNKMKAMLLSISLHCYKLLYNVCR